MRNATVHGSQSGGGGDPGRPSQSGSSLIELLVSLIVGMVFIGAVLSVAIQQGHQRKANTETSLALAAALHNLEQLRTVPQATLAGLDGTGFDVPGSNGAPGGLAPLPGDPNGLAGRFSVVPDQTAGGVTLHRVIATVRWRGVGGTKRVRLQSLIGERK